MLFSNAFENIPSYGDIFPNILEKISPYVVLFSKACDDDDDDDDDDYDDDDGDDDPHSFNYTREADFKMLDGRIHCFERV